MEETGQFFGETTLTVAETATTRHSRRHDCFWGKHLVCLGGDVWLDCDDDMFAALTELRVLTAPADFKLDERSHHYRDALRPSTLDEKVPGAQAAHRFVQEYKHFVVPWAEDKTTNDYCALVFAPDRLVLSDESKSLDFVGQVGARNLGALGSFYFAGSSTAARGLFLRIYGYDVQLNALRHTLPKEVGRLFDDVHLVTFDQAMAKKHQLRADIYDGVVPPKRKKKKQVEPAPAETTDGAPAPPPEPTVPDGPVLARDELILLFNSVSARLPYSSLSLWSRATMDSILGSFGLALDLYIQLHGVGAWLESEARKYLLVRYAQAIESNKTKLANSPKFLAWLDQEYASSKLRVPQWVDVISGPRKYTLDLPRNYSCESFRTYH